MMAHYIRNTLVQGHHVQCTASPANQQYCHQDAQAFKDFRGDLGLASRPIVFLALPRLPSVMRLGHSIGSTGHLPAAQSSSSSSSNGSRATDMPVSDDRVKLLR